MHFQLSWLLMSLWHIPTIAFHFKYIQMHLTTKWDPSSSNKVTLLSIGFASSLKSIKLQSEKELLSIVMVLQESHSMILGINVFIYTDHENLHFMLSTTSTISAGICSWKSMEYVPPYSITQVEKCHVWTLSYLLWNEILPTPEGENLPVGLFDFTKHVFGTSNDPELFVHFLTANNLVEFN